MKNGLENAYNLVAESTKQGIVNTNLKTGTAAAGELKKSNKGGPKNTSAKKPVEAESKINPGHGKIKMEKIDMSEIVPMSRFDSLFKRQLVEDVMEGDESPLEMNGDDGFDDDKGDFPSAGEDTTGEEVDVATELRMIIDRLTEVAEKLGAYDEGMEDADDETGGADLDFGGEEDLQPEAVQAKLTPMKNSVSTMQSRNQKVKSAFNASGRKASTTGGPGKGSADGKLNTFRKSNLGPKMSQKAEVKGTMGKPGAGLFDEV